MNRFIKYTISERRTFLTWILGTILFLLLVIAFIYSPWQPGDDWENFAGAAQRVLTGGSLYGEIIVRYYYANPPWLAVI